MNLSPTEVNKLLRSRRSIYPRNYNKEPIDRSVLTAILENANWAPTHRMTEPWRFRIIENDTRTQLGETLASWYKQNTPASLYKEAKYEKTLHKPGKCAYVIAICMQRDPKKSVPEFEEICATACAVQNILLSAWSYGLGAYWSTPKAINSAEISSFLKLKKGERCLGFVFMGQHDLPEFNGKRSPIEEKVTWL